MNQGTISPIVQTNETAGKGTPKDASPQDNQSKSSKYQFLAGDLQKIRRSNHSTSKGQDRSDAMDDDEHDGIIKGLLYPGLEDLDDQYDFFEEDYEMAQDAVPAVPRTLDAMSFSGPTSLDNHAIHHRSLNSFNDMDEDRTNESNSFYSDYFSSMGRPYSDLSSQKLGR